VVEDPDAPSGIFTHWIVFNLPTESHGLAEDAAQAKGPLEGHQGLNDFGRVGYNGPCPPSGSPHHYYFRIFALDRILHFDKPPRPEAIKSAIQGHVLATGEVVGTFRR
jgi:Raf kinase inhibitor-like YbhB/YbcL family protein